jgi:hypothetical protein
MGLHEMGSSPFVDSAGYDLNEMKRQIMKIKWIGMRVFLPLFVVAALLMTTVETFGASEKSKVKLSVKKKSDKTGDNEETEKDTNTLLTMTNIEWEEETVTLTVVIENKEDHDISGTLEWYFVSNHSSGALEGTGKYDKTPVEAEPAIFCSGEREVSVAAGEKIEEIILSEPFHYEEKLVSYEYTADNKTSYDQEFETGDKFEGYAIMLTVDGEVIASKAPTPKYLKEEWIAKWRSSKSSGGKKKK